MVNGAKIKELREINGLSQAKLGEIVGADQSMIGFIERGVKRPSVELLGYIADYFGVSMDDLRKKESVVAE